MLGTGRNFYAEEASDDLDFGENIKEGIDVSEQRVSNSLPENPSLDELVEYGCIFDFYYEDAPKEVGNKMDVKDFEDFVQHNFEKGKPKTILGESVTKITAVSRHTVPQKHTVYQKVRKEKTIRKLISKFTKEPKPVIVNNWWR